MNPSEREPTLWPSGRDAPDDMWVSETGRLRRDAMLALLQEAVVREGRRRYRRRKAVRGASVVALAIAVSVGLIMHPPARLAPPESGRPATTASPFRIRIARARPAGMSRMIARPTGDVSRFCIDDHTLVETLAAIGRPAGLIRTAGRVRLTAAVTDPIEMAKPDVHTREASPSMQSRPAG